MVNLIFFDNYDYIMSKATEPTIPTNANVTCIITEWLGFRSGVTALINATTALKITIPTR